MFRAEQNDRAFPRVAFDMSSYLWHCLRTGEDYQFGYTVEHNGKPCKVNTAKHGYEIVMAQMVKALNFLGLSPMHAVLVFEGLSSKQRRLGISRDYKSKRGSKPPEEREEFQKLADWMKDLWRGLGAIAITQDYAEGDDTLGFLAKNTESPLTVCTFDGDLLVLKGTNSYGARIDVLYDNQLNINKYGNFDHRLITLYKSLVGDSSDSIDGCPKFGEKSWHHPEKKNGILDLYGEDGCLEILEMLEAGSLDKLHGIAAANQCKHLQRICDNEREVLKSYRLARLYPEWINTMDVPWRVEAGYVKTLPADADERVAHWYGRDILITSDNALQEVAKLKAQFARTPFAPLDIETSQVVESDDWLAEQGRPDGVDPLGAELAGLSMAVGDNCQHRFYFSVDHRDTPNVDSNLVKTFVQDWAKTGKPLIIQNMNFELPVLKLNWPDYGGQEHGYLQNVLDTKLEASHVDENIPRGLKLRSLNHLGYQQVTYEQVTTIVYKGEAVKDVVRDEDGNAVLDGDGNTEACTINVFENMLRGGKKVREINEFTEHLHTESGRILMAQVNTPEGPELASLWVPMRFATAEDYLAAVERGEEPAKPPMIEVYHPPERHQQYKMRELPATRVLSYGLDDSVMTAALHNYYRLIMELEHTWKPYLQVEIAAAYSTAHSYVMGVPYDMAEHNRLVRKDEKLEEESREVLNKYLIAIGWTGTQCPYMEGEADATDIKAIWRICTKRPLATMIRKLDKLFVFLEEVAAQSTKELMLVQMLREAVASGDWSRVNKQISENFDGTPQFNVRSTANKADLLYKRLNVPVRVRNLPTDKMRLAGIFEGTAKTDVLAIDYAIKDLKEVGNTDAVTTLGALKRLLMVATRRSLYFDKYPGFMHWRDTNLHPSVNQSEANTRRSTTAAPNTSQMPKNEKIEGEPPEFRATIPPHKKGAVVASLDFAAQELRLIADDSRDPNMVSCYIGDDRRDMHSLTGVGIFAQQQGVMINYPDFEHARYDKKHALNAVVKACRTLGKKVNFTTEYGAQAPKVAQTLLIAVSEAQAYINAKEAAFPIATQWKLDFAAKAKESGYVRTKMGAMRHLQAKFLSHSKWEIAKGERQAVNTRIQGSAAEMTKLAQGRLWESGILFKYDMRFYFPVHDELVFSIMAEDLPEVLPQLYAIMTAQFADMVIPVESSISFGPDFFRQIEMELPDRPTPEQIGSRLKELWPKYEEAANDKQTALTA